VQNGFRQNLIFFTNGIVGEGVENSIIYFEASILLRGFPISDSTGIELAGPKPMRKSERRLLNITIENEEYQALLLFEGAGYQIVYPKKSMIIDALNQKLRSRADGEATLKLSNVETTKLAIDFI